MKHLSALLICLLIYGVSLAQTSSTTFSSHSSTSISVSSDNNSYSYTAAFDNEKTTEVRKTIINSFGKPVESTSRTAYWEGDGFSISLKTGKVKIKLDKITNPGKSFHLKIEDLGDQISEALDSPKTPPTP